MGRRNKKEKEEDNDGSAPPEVETCWHAMSIEETIKELGLQSDLPKTGLSSDEAAQRLEQYGPNKMTEQRKKTIWERIWDQVANVLVGILVVIALVSVARAVTASTSEDIISNWIQFGLIVFVITTNTIIGIYQEGSAEQAAEALKGMLSSEARVVRDGSEKMIPAEEVVPGDVLVLSLGDRVPADIRVIQATQMACGEAALTGESVPIDKETDAIAIPDGGNAAQTPLGDRRNMGFSATLVAQGQGRGIAIATGDHTQIGTINALVSKVEKKKTAVLEQIDAVSKILAVFILITATITFCIAFWVTEFGALEAVNTGLVAAVAMIPEGLEAIVTMTYAWAVSNMAAQNAIIRALPAVETLGSVTVICSDKTGTLTKNEMSLVAFVTAGGRYRVDVDSKERVNTNFVRDDSYLAERAQHQLGRKTKDMLKDGANTKKKGKHRPGAAENPFAVTEMHLNVSTEPTTASSSAAEAEEPDVPVDSKPKSSGGDGPAAEGESPTTSYINGILSGGILCSKCILGKDGSKDGEIGNPTELSILRAAYFANINVVQLKDQVPIFAEVPFSSEYKFMSTVHEPTKSIQTGLDSDKLIVFAKGAPDRMVPLCKYQAVGGQLTDKEPMNAKYWSNQIAILSSHGLRVLALCIGEETKGKIQQDEQLGPEFVNGRSEPWLTMIGLCAIMDPPRPECTAAISEASGAGVRVAMITGDHKDTALAIGHQLGLVDEQYSEAVTGPEMDAMSDEEIRSAVLKHNVFARASPQNKIRIVKALQAEGQVASMTGDGVNDAPALKAANMGVAMGLEGTDVAREASEMILADDNFATIVVAVKEGRTVWDNLRKVLLVNTPINNAQGMSVLFGLACGLPEAPLNAIQVLYSNLICACTLGFVCAIEPPEDGIMLIPPRRVGKRLIGRYLFLRIALGTTILTAAVVGSVFWIRAIGGYTDKEQRAQAFNVLDFGAISITLSARFAYNSSFHPRLFTGNKFCWFSVILMICLQVICTYTPGLNTVIFQQSGMDGIQWGIVALFTVVVFIIMEIEKSIRRCLKARGADTDDREENPIWDEHFEPDSELHMSSEANAAVLNTVEVAK